MSIYQIIPLWLIIVTIDLAVAAYMIYISRDK